MILALIASISVLAQANLAPRVVPDEIFDTNAKSVSQEIVLLKKRQSVKILGQYAQTSFSQSGVGTTYSTGKTNSLGLLAQHDYSLSDRKLLRTDLFFQPAGFKNPTSNKTSSITRTYLASHYGWNKRIAGVRAQLLAGLAFSNRSAFSDSQNLASSSQSLAPSIGASFDYEVNPQITLVAQAFVNSPLWLQEAKKTGSFENGYHTILRTGMSIKVSKQLRINAEAMYEYEVLSFSGSGDRSIQDARVAYRALSFPIGVEYEF